MKVLSAWLFFLSFNFWSNAHCYEFEFETVVTGINHPTSLVFLNDETALITERNGGLRKITKGHLDPTPITGVPVVFVAGQAGLFDVILDPNFDKNQTIYLSYAQGTAKSNTLKVARARLQGMTLVAVEEIFVAVPHRTTAFHYGGRMAFLADGTLLIGCGDGFDYREQAQFLDNHFGKTIRINSDGSIPSDNPYVGDESAKPEIFSYGHRNPQGMVLAQGQIFLHEHGPRGGDELNLIQPRNNYGWPAITYGVDYSGAHVSPYSKYPGLEQPLLHWTPSIAPGGMTLYNGREFPDWQGNLLVAALAEHTVRRIVLSNNKVDKQEVLFRDLNLRLRDVRQGPKGELYLLTDTDSGDIIRVTARINDF